VDACDFLDALIESILRRAIVKDISVRTIHHTITVVIARAGIGRVSIHVATERSSAATVTWFAVTPASASHRTSGRSSLWKAGLSR